jgi:O-antigen ligase
MIDRTIEVLLILLLVFTPIAFGSQVLWAFSLMELGILLIIILWAVKGLSYRLSVTSSNNKSPITNNHVLITMVLLSLFLGIVVLQMIPLPSAVVKMISPKTHEIRHQLSVKSAGLSYQSSVHSSDDKLGITNDESPVTDKESRITNAHLPITNNQLPVTTLSLFPMGTKIEFLKWFTLAGLFTFLMGWGLLDRGYRKTNRLIIVIFLVGVFESLYGIIEFFSGHRHILNLDWSAWISSVTGTFVNRNYFAGYLLMVIPLSIGFLVSRGANQSGRFRGWRHWLSSLDGKMLLLGFGLILMILGLLLSASRMGILSLLISFSLMSLLFRDPRRGRGVSRIPILIFGLALLWAIWIGLDAVISRFFTVSEDLKSRWMLWGNTLRILKDFPLLGSGLGSFTQVFPMYRSFHIRGLITHAENDFLQMASEVGLCGAGLLLVLFLFLFFRAASGIRSLTSGEPRKYVGIGCLVGILALMFHSIVERNVQVPANAFLFTVMWAMALRIGLHSEQAKVEVKAENWRNSREVEVEPKPE